MTNVVLSKERSIRHTYLLIALLCSTAGAVDLLAFFRIGHLFVANLTGNTVLFAYHLVQQQWASALQCLGIILAFFAGVVTHRSLKRWIQIDSVFLRPSTISLIIECCVLCLLAFLSIDGQLRTILLLLLAWTMGLQNDAFQKIGPISLNTTFLTGDIAKLGGLLVTTADNAEQKRQRREQIGALLTAWSAYVTGAILSAVGNHLIEMKALLISGILTALVLVTELSTAKSSN